MVTQFKTSVQSDSHFYTPTEYLALEENAESKNEYIAGEIIPMTGGTPNHNDIAGNLYAHLKFKLRAKPYKVYIADLRLWIPRYKIYTYPDIMGFDDKLILQDNRNDTVTNPSLIVEVLSKSTKNYDKGEKFDRYRSIPEFHEYILIDQYRYSVQQFAKIEEGKWLLSEYESKDDTLVLSSVDFSIQLQDIYEGIQFD